MLRIIDRHGGTMVIDEFDPQQGSALTADITKILNQGFQRNRPLLKCVGDAFVVTPFNCFGPKVLALRGSWGDDATESRMIAIHMGQRTRNDIPLSLPRSQFDSEALALRNRLLAWRFSHYDSVEVNPALASSTLEDRSNQIGLPLLSLAGSAEVRDKIVAALAAQAQRTADARSDTVPGEVLAAILATVRPGAVFYPDAVAQAVNQQRASELGCEVVHLPAARTLTARRAGPIIREVLELPSDVQERDSKGKRFVAEPKRLAELCRRFNTPFPEPSAQKPAAPSVPRPLSPVVVSSEDAGFWTGEDSTAIATGDQ